MVTVIQAIILGIVQGLTEWLPISSSGHLALFQHLFGLEQVVAFDVMLHLGTLLVIFFVFREDLFRMSLGIIKKDSQSLRMAAFIIIATIPTALAGFLFRDWLERSFDRFDLLGIFFIATAAWLFLSKYPLKKTNNLSFLSSFIIGVSQAVSIIPSVSRSGATIATGLMLGIKREEAAKFSFLIAIPAILGAAVLSARDIAMITDVVPAIIGTMTSAVVGFFSLKFLLMTIKENKFMHFAWYCLVMGILVLILNALKV